MADAARHGAAPRPGGGLTAQPTPPACGGQARLRLLAEHRGYGTRTEVFDGFPDDVRWQWMAIRPAELAGVRYRPADFLFTERGRRLGAFRLRHGLDDAAAAAGLRGRDGQTLHVTPHQLRHTYATNLVNAGMSLQALMALLGPARLSRDDPALCLPGRPAIRTAYEEAMNKARARLTLPIAPAGQPIIPGRVQWLRAEMLKTRVAHGYCSRQLAAEACPYANICEQCDNYVTAPEFIPQLQAQLAEITALRDDAAGRGWHTEVARHSRVIASLQTHLQRLTRAAENRT